MKIGCFRQISSVLFILSLLCVLFAVSGCQQEKPEVDRAELGTIVTELPEIKDMQQSFKLPEGVDEENCLIEKRILRDKTNEKKLKQETK